jgi:large subunit ribosomal protein L6
MSRIGKKPIQIPAGVTVDVNGQDVGVKGPKGALALKLHSHVAVAKSKDEKLGEILGVTVKDEEDKKDRALWGLSNRLIANMIIGVTKGYEQALEFIGVGFKVAVAGRKVKMDVGFSHEVEFDLPTGIEAKAEKNILTLTGIDKQLVGETAARIRRIRKPEPYKGKGIKYVEEVVRRKAGKAAKAAGAK